MWHQSAVLIGEMGIALQTTISMVDSEMNY